jgi:hypothetical protein
MYQMTHVIHHHSPLSLVTFTRVWTRPCGCDKQAPATEAFPSWILCARHTRLVLTMADLAWTRTITACAFRLLFHAFVARAAQRVALTMQIVQASSKHRTYLWWTGSVVHCRCLEQAPPVRFVLTHAAPLSKSWSHLSRPL